MNRKIGMIGSAINTAAVFGFALCLVNGVLFGSYLTSMFIAFGFVMMMGGFAAHCPSEKKAAGHISLTCGGIYAAYILLVYFAQVTAVRLNTLNEQALRLIDYTQFGLFFSYNLLGYGMMALSTFFAGLTIEAATKQDKWLKWLLLIHGVFFISCFIMPMTGIFCTDMPGVAWIGSAVLLFWCVYFLPVGILSFQYFRRRSAL